MKHAKNNCKKCGGEQVVFVKGKGKTHKGDRGYYIVCDSCNPSKEDKESEMSGADGPNSGER